MTTEKPVTNADLTWLRDIRDRIAKSAIGCDRPALAGLDRLIAAAEADAPPPAEGWYLWDGIRAVYYDGERRLYTTSLKHRTHFWAPVDPESYDRLHPVRPTITEADLERAILAYGSRIGDRRTLMRAAFEAAGIEVTP